MGPIRHLFNVLRWELSRSTKRLYRNSSIAFGIGGTLFLFWDIAEHFLHWLPEPSKKLLYVVVCFFVITAILHFFLQIEEWKQSKRERKFAKSLASILDEFSALDFEAIRNGDFQSLANFVNASILKRSAESLLCSGPSFSVMLQPEENARLEIFYQWPPETVFGNYRPRPGEGAAGTAFEENQTLYVPIKEHRGGMILSKEGLLEGTNLDLFVEPAAADPFKCILCVPIAVGLPGNGATVANNVLGVLNLHSDKTFGISDFDMDVAQVTARLLALVFDTRQKAK